MGISYKNFWSLNMDEAIATGILRYHTLKNVEVFMPANAQMKDIDLVLLNIDNKKVRTMQVKGSRAYKPSSSEIKKFGRGNSGWFTISKNKIHKSKVDYFTFIVYVMEEELKKGRRRINPHIIIIPTKILKKLCKKYKKINRRGNYNFYLWVNPKEKKVFDWRNKNYDISEYLDKRGFNLLAKDLK